MAVASGCSFWWLMSFSKGFSMEGLRGGDGKQGPRPDMFVRGAFILP